MFLKKFTAILFFITYIIYLYSFNLAYSHPIPLVFTEFVITYQRDKVILKYRLSIDPTVINSIYPTIDNNQDEITSQDELNQHWNETVKPNLITIINGQPIHLEITDYFIINKRDFRSLNDYLEITLEANIQNTTEIHAFFKYNHKYLPEDPYGDSVNFIDNISNNPEIERLDDLQYFQLLNGNEYTAKFRFINTNTQKITTQEKSNLTFNINTLTKDLINNFKNLEFSNPIVALSGFFILFISGILHAFTPGHGKTVISVILANKKDRNLLDLVILSISIITSHTGIIIILGALLYIFNLGYLINSISTTIKDVISFVFMIFGVYLVYKSYNSYKIQKLKTLLINNNTYNTYNTKDNFTINRKSIIYSGLLAGLTPCVEAVSIFILFLNLGRIDIAFLSTLVFSLGLMISIFVIGFVLIYYTRKSKFLKKIELRAEYLVTLVSGTIIIFLSLLNIVQK